MTTRTKNGVTVEIESFSAPPFKVPPKGLGDMIEQLAKPIAKALGLPCLDKDSQLKPESPCAKRRDALNKMVPFKK
jgi:hypothetical protein